MELFASTVVWDGGGKLTVYDKTQGVQNVQRYLCGVFALKPDQVRVLSPYVGGAFGAGLRPQYQVVLAVLGAQALERSVRLVLTRQQMYALGYRPGTIERLAIGAAASGTLDSITHEAIAMTSRFESFGRNDTSWSGLLYRCDNANYVHKLAHLDLPTSADMRAPGAATGVYALESAMDELAVALKIDPLELRLKCYSDRDQNDKNKPYSSKGLRECYQQGAEAFGWSKRKSEPRSMRDGGDLVDVERRGVGGKDGAGLHDGVELGEDVLLDVHLLEHGLDHEIAIGNILVGEHGRDQSQALVHFGLCQAAAIDLRFPVAGHDLGAAVMRLLRHLQLDDGNAGVGKRHGDAAAHRAGADDSHLLDGTRRSLVVDARHLGRLALGEEGVDLGAALRLAHQGEEQLALAGEPHRGERDLLTDK